MKKYFPLILLLFIVIAMSANENPVFALQLEISSVAKSFGKKQYDVAGELLYSNLDFEGALVALGEAEKIFRGLPEGFDRYYWLGRVYLLQAQLLSLLGEEDTEELLISCGKKAKQALTFQKKSAAAHLLMGEALWERGQKNIPAAFSFWPQAFLLLEEAVVLDKENHAAQSALAEYYLDAGPLLGGDIKKAILILENLPPAENKIEVFLASFRLGSAYYEDGQFEEAMDAFSDSLSLYEEYFFMKFVQKGLSLRKPGISKDWRFGILPVFFKQGFDLGVDGTVGYKDSAFFVKGSLAPLERQFYYNLGAQYNINEETFANLGYYKRLAKHHPGYATQKGLEANLFYSYGQYSNLTLGFFGGELGNRAREFIDIKSMSCTVSQPIYQDGGRLVGLQGHITLGKAEDKSYYRGEVRLPIKYESYKGLLDFGYIKQGDNMDLYYTSPVRGYFDDEKKGHCRLLVSLERSLPLFPYTTEPFLGMIHGAVFADWGVIFVENGKPERQKCLGGGLHLKLPALDIRLELALTGEGKVKPVFNIGSPIFPRVDSSLKLPTLNLW